MAKEKDLVEDALLQMKNLEEAVAKNAKGILASTMGQEIKELVKESLSEQDDEVEDSEVTSMGDDEEEMVDTMDMTTDMDDMEDDETMSEPMMGDMEDTDDMSDMSMDTDMDDDEEVIDLTDASDEEILKVFKSMGEDDGIIVKKDDDMLHLEDENEGTEYMIDLGESEMDETEEENEFWGPYEGEMDESSHKEGYEMEEAYDEGYEMEESSKEEEEDEGVVYEIVMDESDDDDDDEDEMDESEDYDFKKSKKTETKEGKMSMKPKVGKGASLGSPKFSYEKQKGGFKEDMKKGNPTMGTGKPKFEYKEGKKSETKEASRTLGTGKYFGKKGLPKPKAAPQHLRVENDQTKDLKNQISVLREKNEEYRKALNIFRDKLNEVAVFNSNLAYATRLFTEHTTSKQEKINILRRFDGVETIKESKSLYKTLKDELSGNQGKVVTEGINKVIDREPQSGSASNLIESKTYENPQFLRMKDLMSKIIK